MTKTVKETAHMVTALMDIPFYIAILIQIALIIHVIRTGRERIWIFVLLFLPLLGGLAYFVMEILPDLMGGVRGQKAARGVMQLVDPGGDIRSCARAWEQSANADNGRRYAQALVNANKAQEALKILAQAREGFFKHDPTLLLLQAQAQFLLEQWPESVASINLLKSENPDFQSAEGDLLLARAMEKNGQSAAAISAYRDVVQYFPGAEARYRLAMALKADGQTENARSEFDSILNDAQLAPAHYRKSQRVWIRASKDALKTLE